MISPRKANDAPKEKKYTKTVEPLIQRRKPKVKAKSKPGPKINYSGFKKTDAPMMSEKTMTEEDIKTSYYNK